MTPLLRLLAIPLIYLMGWLVMQPYEWWMGPTFFLAYAYTFFAATGINPWEKEQ